MSWFRSKARLGQTFSNNLDEVIHVWVEPNCLGFELHPGERLTLRFDVPDDGFEPVPLDLSKDEAGTLLLTVSDQTDLSSEFWIDDVLIAREWTLTEAGLSRIRQ